jgi:hypothetical protein
MFLRYSEDEFDDLFLYKHLHADIIIPEIPICPTIFIDGVEIFVHLIHDLEILFHVFDGISSFIASFGGDAFRDFDLQIPEFLGLMVSVFFLEIQKNRSADHRKKDDHETYTNEREK